MHGKAMGLRPRDFPTSFGHEKCYDDIPDMYRTGELHLYSFSHYKKEFFKFDSRSNVRATNIDLPPPPLQRVAAAETSLDRWANKKPLIKQSQYAEQWTLKRWGKYVEMERNVNDYYKNTFTKSLFASNTNPPWPFKYHRAERLERKKCLRCCKEESDADSEIELQCIGCEHIGDPRTKCHYPIQEEIAGVSRISISPKPKKRKRFPMRKGKRCTGSRKRRASGWAKYQDYYVTQDKSDSEESICLENACTDTVGLEDEISNELKCWDLNRSGVYNVVVLFDRNQEKKDQESAESMRKTR